MDGESPAALVYTSGTTGVSKGAILTHNNFAVNAANLLEAWRITSTDRFLLALPLFHVHALGNGLHCWLFSGCRMRLLERFEHEKAAAEFLDFRPTLFFGVPTIYVRLLETPPETAREIGRSMRLFVSGSAPLPAQVLEDFRKLFGHTILERYGMTETIMNISNPYDGERRPGSVGFPLPGVQARILNREGQDVPDGETGELYLKGPNVFPGYWRREDATRAAFVDGWFKTGDLAQRSPDGYYTLCGRRSDLIISGGFNIYPREIEEFLMEQPEVAEAAVAAEPDRVRGEVPVAYIVPRGDLRGLAIRTLSKPAAAKTSPPSNARGALSSSKSFRATRWAKCKSTCWEPPRSEDPDGGVRGHSLRQNRRSGGRAGIAAGGPGSLGRRSRRGPAQIPRGGNPRRGTGMARHAAVGGPALLSRWTFIA